MKSAFYGCYCHEVDITAHFKAITAHQSYVRSPRMFGSLRCHQCPCNWLRMDSYYYYDDHGQWINPPYVNSEPRKLELEILRAWYAMTDVTTAVQNLTLQRKGLYFRDDEDLNMLLGGDPLPGQPKDLHIIYRFWGHVRELRLSEAVGRLNPSFPGLPVAGELNVLHGSGLSNQLYSIAVGGLIACKLARRVPLSSLQITARVRIDDDLLDPKLKHHFSYLFDVESLLASPMPVYDDGVTDPGHLGELISIQDWRIGSEQVLTKLQRPTPIITVIGILSAIRPDNIADYQIVIDILRACRPCRRLQTYVQALQERIPGPYNTFHYRYGADWPTEEHVGTDSECFLRLLQAQVLPNPDLPLYVCGAIPPSEQAKIKAVKANVIFKEDLYPQITQELGYEELAVVERDIALRCEYFIGYPSSTFSLAVVLQRNNCRSTFYNLPGFSNEPYLLFKDGKPLWYLPAATEVTT